MNGAYNGDNSNMKQTKATHVTYLCAVMQSVRMLQNIKE